MSVLIVGIGIEHTIEVQRIALGEFQAKPHVEVAPLERVRSHVVAHAQRELINQADLLEAGRVFVRTDFHLDVVVDRETDVALFTGAGHAIHVVREGRIGVFVIHAVNILIDIRLVIAEASRSEVGSRTDRDRGLHTMANHLHLFT